MEMNWMRNGDSVLKMPKDSLRCVVGRIDDVGVIKRLKGVRLHGVPDGFGHEQSGNIVITTIGDVVDVP
jgi:hypothetical protein